MYIRIVEQDKKRKVADEIVVYLDNYKAENDELPANLLAMNKGLEDYRYICDSLNRNYTLQYSIDGWHYARYTSKIREWVEGD